MPNQIGVNNAAQANAFTNGALYQRTTMPARPGRHIQNGDVYIAVEDGRKKRMVNLRTGNTSSWDKIGQRVTRIAGTVTLTATA